MTQDKRDVMIHLATAIDDHGEMEYTTGKQTGQFFHKEDVDVLIYQEELEEGAIIRNLMTIRPGKINIKRSGLITMNQQFHLNQKTETYYQHPHGRLHMETFTHSITYESMKISGQGQLTINYTVKLNGIEARKHVLELTYYEEDAK